MASNPTSQEKQTQRPKKLRSACDTCHQTKVRCSGGNPCQMCQHVRAECIYSPSSRKGRPKGTRPRKSLEQEKRASNRQEDATVDVATGEACARRKQLEHAGELSSSDVEPNIPGNDLEDLALPDEYREMLCSSSAIPWPGMNGLHMNDALNPSLLDNFLYDMAPSLDAITFPAWENWFPTSSNNGSPWQWCASNQSTHSLGNWNNGNTAMPSISTRHSISHSLPSFTDNPTGGFGSDGVYAPGPMVTPTSSNLMEGAVIGPSSGRSEDGQECLQSHTVALCHQLGRVRAITTPRIDVLLTCAREIVTVCFSLLACSRCQNGDIHEVLIIIIAVFRLLIRKMQLCDAKRSSPLTDTSNGGITSRVNEDMMIDDDDLIPRNASAKTAPPRLSPSQIRVSQITAPITNSMQPDLVPVSVGNYQITKSELTVITDVLRKGMLQRLGEVITAFKRRILNRSFNPPNVDHIGDINAEPIVPDDENNSDGDSDTDNYDEDRTNAEELGDLAQLTCILQSLEEAVHNMTSLGG